MFDGWPGSVQYLLSKMSLLSTEYTKLFDLYKFETQCSYPKNQCLT